MPACSGQRFPVNRLYFEFGFVLAITIRTAIGTRAPFCTPTTSRCRRLFFDSLPDFKTAGDTSTSRSDSIVPTSTAAVSACALMQMIAVLVTHCSTIVLSPKATISGIHRSITDVSIDALSPIINNQHDTSLPALKYPCQIPGDRMLGVSVGLSSLPSQPHNLWPPWCP